MDDQSTLQINVTGAWRTVAPFDPACTLNVIDAARMLGAALGGRATFRVVAADGKRKWFK